MAMHASVTPKGLEEYIKKIQQAGNNVDQAAVEAVEAGADFMLEEMQKRVKPHYDKGDAYAAVKRKPVSTSGTLVSAAVGAMDIRGDDQDGFHVVYQEYGSPGRLEKDPWLSPALEQSAKMRRIMADVLKRKGVPTGE